MSRPRLAQIVHEAINLSVLVLTLVTRDSLAADIRILRVLGLGGFAAGLLLVAYSVTHLKERGNIEPASESLVTDGPYGLVRHPTYLGTLVGVVGLAVGLLSLWGLLTAVLLALPASVNRARLEDEALERRFGEEWRGYADRTSSMFPPIY